MMLEALTITCPYCGEANTLNVDCSAGDQHFIEDCRVCCRPMELTLQVDDRGRPAGLEARRDDE